MPNVGFQEEGRVFKTMVGHYYDPLGWVEISDTTFSFVICIVPIMCMLLIQLATHVHKTIQRKDTSQTTEQFILQRLYSVLQWLKKICKKSASN